MVKMEKKSNIQYRSVKWSTVVKNKSLEKWIEKEEPEEPVANNKEGKKENED